MKLRPFAACGGLVFLLLAGGCGHVARINLANTTGGNAALVGQFRAYDGQSGRALSFREVAECCRSADVIFFGEEHNDIVCNEIEAQLLYALQTQERPAALALEFFETDTQAALDAYLLGRIAELPFRKETRQGRAYLLSHRPLIELCRIGHIPVLAANAPRRLVRAYRNSGLEFEDFRAGLEAADQRWLPTSNDYLSGAYEERFLDMMRDHAMPAATQPTSAPASMPAAEPATQPATAPAMPSPAALYRSQLLWDQTMAESLANFRARFPSHRVLLVVGTFHVTHTGGTAIKFRQRRPDDRVLTIAYRGTADGDFPFDADDCDAGDIVIYGLTPPPEEEHAPGPPPGMPGATPTTSPAPEEAQPTTTAPASTQPSFLPREIPIRDVLVIGGVGKSRRSSIHTDAVEAQLIAGRWTPPVAGETVESPDGATRTWTAITATDDGWIRDEALGGGYVYAAIESDREQFMLLDARGHNMVYVNGEPRVGDPYQWGFVRVPVALHAGTNTLLFVCGRGELRARLVEPHAPILLDIADVTLPDLIVGENSPLWAAVVVTNTTGQMLRDAKLVADCAGETIATPLPPIPPLSTRKVGFQIPAATGTKRATEDVLLALLQDGTQLDTGTCHVRVRQPSETHKRTFVSKIDGSVQYYAVQPRAAGASDATPPAMFLTLHGASVEGLRQAECYAHKSWGYVVAPTNRRPYGFDWEDWGRIDAFEVLADAQQRFGTDPLRTYLTGHSMGGHGTWHLGVTYPDRFAAIAPSASWRSFFTYGGAVRFDGGSPIEAILNRATNPSFTTGLLRNTLRYGVYILHGDQDETVPVAEARAMRADLGVFHPNLAYYERPGAGHWWGNECMDWPPLFDFLRQNTKPAVHAVRHVEFVTANPAISATCDWATIEAQTHALEFSRIDLQIEPKERLLRGTTENVARLTIQLAPEKGASNLFDDAADAEPQPLQLELDGDRLENVAWPADDGVLRLARLDEHWRLAPGSPNPQQKGPHRAGPFKEAFRHRVQLVYGTHGAPDENAWAWAKARYDAETFQVRGNGGFDVLPDTGFDPTAEPDRGVVLYGNAATNSAWNALLPDCPIQLTSSRVQIAEQAIEGDDLAVLATYPRPGSDKTLVGMVGGTGLPGMRLTERLPYFVAGVAYPDWIVIGPEMLQSGTAGVRAAGFFGNDWQVDPQQSAWAEGHP